MHAPHPLGCGFQNPFRAFFLRYFLDGASRTLSIFQYDLKPSGALFLRHLQPIETYRSRKIIRRNVEHAVLQLLQLARHVVAIFHNDDIVARYLSRDAKAGKNHEACQKKQSSDWSAASR